MPGWWVRATAAGRACPGFLWASLRTAMGRAVALSVCCRRSLEAEQILVRDRRERDTGGAALQDEVALEERRPGDVVALIGDPAQQRDCAPDQNQVRPLRA